ncbi:MAG TPA: DNA polymerase III subunit delta [Bacteroidales bacterium]|nr:DNA polymerase III subunit delta [Bacteroidales bacterium]
MLFKDIVGQEQVKQKLIKSVKEGRIPHAQLFTGQDGTGKLALAIAYAQYISCQQKGEEDSCGICPSCHKFNKLIHPDLHFVFPIILSERKSDDDEKGPSGKLSDAFMVQWREVLLENPYITEADWYEMIGAENKQGIIGTTESSDVIRKLSMKSFESDYKTMIIWLPERMNQQAANKLLKLIEEPPQNTTFLMVSENPTQLLKTILSRTQVIKVPPIHRESIALALVDRYQMNPSRANDISRISNGNYRKAMSLISVEEENPYFPYFRSLMRLCYSNDVLGLLDWVGEASSLGREQQKELLTESLRLLRESLMLNMNLEDISYLAGEEIDFGKKFSPFINQSNVYQVFAEFNSAIDHISRNGNAQIIFTDMCMKLVKMINK